MAYRQILYPCLDTADDPLYVYQGGQLLYDWLGWCLAVAAASFDASGGSWSAKTAWQSCSTQHRDYNLPEGVWIPVWWEGGEYGHVAEAYVEDGQITVYSSPYTHKPSFDVFRGGVYETLNYIGRVYGVGDFSGWSETLLNSRIIEWYDDRPKPEKSNEEICKEVWEGLWGVGEERKRRLEEAGYDYDTIQAMIDEGIGKPEDDSNSEPEPEPTTEPDEPSEPSDEPTEPIEDEPKDDDNNNDNKEDNMAVPEPVEPAKGQDAQFIGGIIEEASDAFEPTKTMKLIAYLVGDVLLVAAILIPDIVNAIQAPNASIWAEYTSKVLLEAGTCILLVFKLIKKKK